jgi:hypothetical protein
MKKSTAGKQPRPSDGNGAAPAGRRSGRGASSVVPYLEEARSSKPAPLEPLEGPQVPRKRSLWPW